MRKYLFLILIIFISIGCRSRKVAVNVEKGKELTNVQVQKETQSTESVDETLKFEKKSSDFEFNQALNLSPIRDDNGVFQPVKYKELRNGKPFREIEIIGGSLSENSNQIESNQKEAYQHEKKQILTTLNKIDSLNNTMFNYFEKKKDVEVKGVQFGVYAIIGILILMIMLLAYWSTESNKLKSI